MRRSYQNRESRAPVQAFPGAYSRVIGGWELPRERERRDAGLLEPREVLVGDLEVIAVPERAEDEHGGPCGALVEHERDAEELAERRERRPRVPELVGELARVGPERETAEGRPD